MGRYPVGRPVAGRCGVCGRVRLSRSEYAWRQANRLPVWRCQHRRRMPSPSRDLAEAVALIAALAALALATVR
jgi:hypothetical protein